MREFLAEGDVSETSYLEEFTQVAGCDAVLVLMNKLLVAEVQALMGDGAMSLHTRSLKYGKVSPPHQSISPTLPIDDETLTRCVQLRNGHLLTLPPRLIRRLKSHFHHLPPPCGPTGVDVILGLNGFVWVSSGTAAERREGGEGFDAEGVYSDKNDVSHRQFNPQWHRLSRRINIHNVWSDVGSGLIPS